MEQAIESLAAFRSWLTDFIREGRDEAAAEPLASHEPLFEFAAPCQVDIIHLSHSFHHLDFRLCIFTHFDDLPDIEIKVYRPYYPIAFTKGLEAYGHSPKWVRPLPLEHRSRYPFSKAQTYAEALESAILNAYGPVRVYLNNTIKGSGIDGQETGSILLLGDCWSWGIGGEIERKYPDATIYARQELEKRRRANGGAQKSGEAQPLPKSSGKGTFLLPPTWIGEAPKLSVSENLDSVRPEQTGHWNVVHRGEYRDLELSVTQSGFFAVGTEDAEIAAKRLNELFAVMLFHGQPAIAVAPTDLVHFQEIGAPLTSYGWDEKLHHEQVNRLRGDGWPSHKRRESILPVERLQSVIVEADALKWAAQQSAIAGLCLQAWTQLQRRENRASFLAAWTATEMVCSWLWEHLLMQRAVPAGKLRDLLHWDINRVIDILMVESVISHSRATELHQLRERRNRVIHRAEPVRIDHAWSAIDIGMAFAAPVLGLEFSEERRGSLAPS